jgi:hypothetical protein
MRLPTELFLPNERPATLPSSPSSSSISLRVRPRLIPRRHVGRAGSQRGGYIIPTVTGLALPPTAMRNPRRRSPVQRAIRSRRFHSVRRTHRALSPLRGRRRISVSGVSCANSSDQHRTIDRLPPSCAPAWCWHQGQSLRVLRKLDAAVHGRTTGMSAPGISSIPAHQEACPEGCRRTANRVWLASTHRQIDRLTV